MKQVTLTVIAETKAAEEVASAALHRTLSHLEAITVQPAGSTRSRKYRARITGLEVLATFLTSAAAYQLARALRDYVKRQKVEVKVETSDGRKATIKAEGGDMPAVADLVGFLTKQHKKISTTTRKRLSGRPTARK